MLRRVCDIVLGLPSIILIWDRYIDTGDTCSISACLNVSIYCSHILGSQQDNNPHQVFNQLVSRAHQCLERQTPEFFHKLHQEVCSIRGLFSPNKQKKLKEAESTKDMFDILGEYWDFINYRLLKFVIDKSGSKEIQKMMEAYICALYNFPVTTLVVKENPPSDFSVVETTLQVVSTNQSCTLHDFESHRRKLQEAWKLESMALRTEKVDIEQQFALLSLPRQYVPHILDLLPRFQVLYSS